MSTIQSSAKRTWLVGALAVCAVGFALVLFLREGGATGDGAPARVFFSTDDGKTWFAQDSRSIPPFMKDGKEAVRAYIYKCPDGKQFAAWLERYTPESKKKIEAIVAGGDKPPELMPLDAPQMEVKSPGQPTWLNSSDPKAAAIMTAKCPGGGEVELVTP